MGLPGGVGVWTLMSGPTLDMSVCILGTGGNARLLKGSCPVVPVYGVWLASLLLRKAVRKIMAIR